MSEQGWYHNALFFYQDDKGGVSAQFAVATAVDHGMSIQGTGEASTRTQNVWFAKVVTSSSFDVSLVWKHRSEAADKAAPIPGSGGQHYRGSRDAFLDWIKDYSERVTGRGSLQLSPIRAIIAMPEGLATFDRWGVPTSGMLYDYEGEPALYRAAISFAGTRGFTQDRRSKTVAPGGPFRSLKKLYPGGYSGDRAYSTIMSYDLPSDTSQLENYSNPREAAFLSYLRNQFGFGG
jgi:hypothetical protein